MESSASEISKSKISNCSIANIEWKNVGSIKLNQIISDGSLLGILFLQGSAKVSSLKEISSVNISNSRLIVRKRSISAIHIQLAEDLPIDINIDSVSITGVNGSGILGMYIADYSPEAGSKPNYRTVYVYTTSRLKTSEGILT